jgi:hypothetical protein
MIITKLQGGLANQLFQWAYGRHLSNKYNTPLYLETEAYKQYTHGDTKRFYSLSKFPNINSEIFNPFNYPNNGKRFQQLVDNFNYNELNYNDDFNYYLNGYWQSEKYFLESLEIIKSDLRPSEDLLKKLKSTPFIDTNTISIHVRRTDYVTSNGYHPVQPIEYYKKAIEIIGDYDYIFVFSDDINWCKENLPFEKMIFMEGLDDVEDLLLMSMCKNNIIANSTFSWWGAWLNSNADKKVVAPLNWFGKETNINTNDIIPSNWIKI